MPDPATETRDPSIPAPAGPTDVDEHAGDQPLVEADLLVEDVSIDGMCGVY